VGRKVKPGIARRKIMAISFNIDEIFEMAEQIERNAAKFYREAARNAPDKASSKTFIDLSAMEDGHFRIFQDMRKKLAPEEKEQTTFDPENQAASYLQGMANLHGSEGKKDRDVKLTGKETVNEVYKIAVDAEKNSIVFYSALKDLVSGPGKDKIEQIIKEELGHLAVLKLKLAELS
jgi:rubrerythrin